MTVTDDDTRAVAAGTVDGFTARAARLQAAERAVDALESDARDAARELVAAVEAHHAAVLWAVVAGLRADEYGSELLYGIVEDPEVYTSLVKAGIVRPTLAMRAVQVLDGIRPTCRATTGRGAGADRRRRRLRPPARRLPGCGSSTTTLRDSVAEALLAHLAEVHEVEEVPADMAPVTAFVPVSSVGVRRPGAAGRAVP